MKVARFVVSPDVDKLKRPPCLKNWTRVLCLITLTIIELNYE